MDRATTAVLQRLRRGPASTVELQAELYATHVPKQIFDLRQADYDIRTIRLRNGTALYQLVSEPGIVEEAERARAFHVAHGGDGPGWDQAMNGPDVPVGAGRDQSTESRKLPAGPPAPSRASVPQPAEFIDVLVAARAAQAAVDALTRRPQFGDPALLREMRRR